MSSTAPPTNALRAAIFDMDGLLVDSEPLWTRAEIEIFGEVGIHLDATTTAETVGMSLEEVVEYRHRQKPWTGRSLEDVGASIHQRVAALLRTKGRPMDGAREVIELVKGLGAKVGLATASDPELIEAALGTMGLLDAFDAVSSGALLPYGKPHPMVYLECARALDVPPSRAVAFEDSVTGLIAAKAAKMLAVAVPEPRLADDPRYTLADMILSSLEAFDAEAWDELSARAHR